MKKKAYSIYMLYSCRGKIVNNHIKVLWNTREEAEAAAKKWYPTSGWRIEEWEYYDPSRDV